MKAIIKKNYFNIYEIFQEITNISNKPTDSDEVKLSNKLLILLALFMSSGGSTFL